MGTQISLVGVGSSNVVPGVYAQVNFAAGPSAGTGNTYDIILVGPASASGSATVATVYGPDTPVQMANESDAIALFGPGSGLHEMYRDVVAVNTSTRVFAIPVTTTGSQVAASKTVTLTTVATGSWTGQIDVGPENVQFSIASGDSLSTMATNACSAVNSKTWWPVTAENPSAGQVKFKAKCPGTSGNNIRVSIKIIRPGTGAPSSDTTSPTAMTGGSVADDLTSALATIATQRYAYIALHAFDSTQIGAASTQVTSMALPSVGLRQRLFAASVDTVSNAITLSTAINSPRCELVWHPNSDWTPGRLAANEAAWESLFESNFTNASLNMDLPTQAMQAAWRITPQKDGTTVSNTTLQSAINSGISPIATQRGRTYLVKRVTTYFLNGSVNDFRIRETHKVVVCDRYTDDLVAKALAFMGGKVLLDDPINNTPALPPNAVSPRVAKSMIDRLTTDYGESALVDHFQDTVNAGTLVQRSTNPAGRLNASIDLQPVNIFSQFCILVNQIA